MNNAFGDGAEGYLGVGYLFFLSFFRPITVIATKGENRSKSQKTIRSIVSLTLDLCTHFTCRRRFWRFPEYSIRGLSHEFPIVLAPCLHFLDLLFLCD